MAAGGMYRPQDLGRVPLAARRRGSPEEPRSCWLLVPDQQIAATVHGWRRVDESAEWEALVVVWVPQRVVHPRP